MAVVICAAEETKYSVAEVDTVAVIGHESDQNDRYAVRVRNHVVFGPFILATIYLERRVPFGLPT